MDLAAKVELETRRYAVARQITCPVTGEVLDVRTAVLVECNEGRTSFALSREGWRRRKDALRERIPDLVVSNEPKG